MTAGRLTALFGSLRMQLMLYFVGISMVVLSVGSYLTYRNMLDLFEQRNEELILQQFAQTEQNLLNLVEEVNRLSGVFLLDENVQEFLEISDYALVYENVETVRGILRKADDIIINYPYIDSIYLFTENREAIGTSKGNSLILREEQQEHPFFSTEMFREARFDNPQSSWYGGYTQDFFNESLRLTGRPMGHLISQVKGVRAIANPNRNGILVFNIDERYLYSLYGKLRDDAGDENTYIIDGSGRIISGEEGSIGTISEAFERLDSQSTYGSISTYASKKPSQLIYYKLENLDWFILREVPLSLDSQYAFSLQRTYLFTLLLSIISILTASFFWLRKVLYPLNSLAAKMSDVGQGHLGLTLKQIPKNELGLVVKRFNEMSTSIARLIRENKAMEEEKREIEIEALQAQINPHFLYNTLNMIKWMAVVMKAENIVNSLVALGNIIKPIFSSNDTMCTLKDELNYLENYVKIMNWRFGNRVRFHIHVAEGIMQYKVPRFILQPLVENSITHGLRSGEDYIEIDIAIEEIGTDLVITVTDTGVGIPENKLEEINSVLSGAREGALTTREKGIGIYNVHRRVQLYYGDQYGIHLECPEGGGTRVSARIHKVS